jgi:hypothetical protein
MGKGGVIRPNKSLKIGNVFVRHVNEELFSTWVCVDDESRARRQGERTRKGSY